MSVGNFGFRISEINTLYEFPNIEDVKEINGFISNDLTHETFSQIDDTLNEKDSSIFFIIGESKIKS